MSNRSARETSPTRKKRTSGPDFPRDTDHAERRRWLQTLANLPLLSMARDRTVERIIRNAVFARHAPRTPIFLEHEPAQFVFMLLEGTVRVFQQDPSGAQYSPKIFSAPTHFGDLGALAGLPQYRSSVESLTPSVTACITIGVIEQCLADDHPLTLAWLHSVARQHSVTIDSDRQNVFGGLTARMVNVLLGYADRFGVPDGDGMIGIDHTLSYQTLAMQAGCTRRAAIATMQRLEQQKLLKRTGDGWVVNLPALQSRLIPGHLSISHSFLDCLQPKEK